MMNKFKIVATDFDGTLLRSDHTLSQKTIETIRRFKNAGGLFVVTTGRMCLSIIQELEKNCLLEDLVDGFVIGYNGAMIKRLCDNQIVFHNPIAPNVAQKILKHFEDLNLQTQIYFDETLFCSEANEYTQKYASATGVKNVLLHLPLSEYVSKNQQPLTKILAFASENVVAEQLEIMAQLFPDATVTSSVSTFIEATAKDTNKGTGVARFAKMFELTVDDCIGFGDSRNDIALLKAVGFAVAVANASPHLKQFADHICASNDDDGVARTMEQFCDLKPKS